MLLPLACTLPQKSCFPRNNQNELVKAELTTLLRASESLPNLDEIQSPSVTCEALSGLAPVSSLTF